MVICLGRGADLHMVQLVLLPLTVSCYSKSRLVLPFWFGSLGCPGQRAVKRMLLLFMHFIGISSDLLQLKIAMHSCGISTVCNLHFLLELYSLIQVSVSAGH